MSGSSDDKDAEVPWLFGLKVFVVVAGIVLVLGSVVLVWLLASRTQVGEGETRAPAVAVSSETGLAGGVTGEAFVAPAGSRIIEAGLDGASVLLLLEDATGKQYLAVLETASGRQRFMIELGASAP